MVAHSVTEESLEALTALLSKAGYDAVRAFPAGDHVILKGVVGDYASKRSVEGMVRQMGVTIQNCLRVVPAAVPADNPAGDADGRRVIRPATLLEA